MKRARFSPERTIIGAAILVCFAAPPAGSQLAITEVMSSASTNNQLGALQGPDFWELTNFGSEPIDLTGFRWNDNSGGWAAADPNPFEGLVIGPGETILFVQDNVPEVSTPEAFRAWWGLPDTQKVVFYTGNGLSSAGDSVILWSPAAVADEDYMDRVDFGAAVPGRTFTYDTATGSFGRISEPGLPGVRKAALSDDMGSPGEHDGPVALEVMAHPTNLVAVAGLSAELTVKAVGLPRPRYQWYRNGVPVAGATSSVLRFESISPDDAGNYHAVLQNGIQSLATRTATVSVIEQPVPPTLTLLPQTLEAYPGQTVRFQAALQANPPPLLQWFKDGTALPEATTPELILPSLTRDHSGNYTLLASNIAGVSSATVTLIVTNRPRLLITEVHPTGSAVQQDWWELTSFDSRPISLQGYRFDDDSRSLATAFVITQDVVIHPGQSIVFVESTASRPMTPEAFRAWWGDQVPGSTPIIVYQGPGLGLSSSGDAVYLWNAAATEDSDFLCGVTFGASPTEVRRTFVYDPDHPEPQYPFGGLLTTTAQLGVDGAILSTLGDVGSPGRVVDVPALHLDIVAGLGLLQWSAVPGRTYRIEETLQLRAFPLSWRVLAQFQATNTPAILQFPISEDAAFFRIGVVLPYPEP